MSDQDKIDQLEVQNRELVKAFEKLDNCTFSFDGRKTMETVRAAALSNSPVHLYRKEQEVIEAAICAKDGFISRELIDAVANLQQARQEQE